MTKPHLTARVPNEGARRLAQWLLRQPAGAYDRLGVKLGIGVIGLSRLLAGEVTPSAARGYEIYSSTKQAVTINDWYRPALGGWFDADPLLEQRRAA